MGSPLFPNWNNKKKQDEIAAEIAKAAGAAGKTPGGLKAWLTKKVGESVAKKLGMTGQVIAALLRPFGKSLTSDVKKEIEAAGDILNEINSIQPELVSEPHTRKEPIVIRGGQNDDSWREFPENKPLIEPFIQVKSSNVHSFSYRHQLGHTGNGDLLVMFLGILPGGKRGGEGALYAYKSVPYSIFEAFKHTSSAGKFVWSELRIKGTVSGHVFDYDIEALGNLTRVPRQSGFVRGRAGEYFIPRTLNGVRSTLPKQLVRGSGASLKDWDRRGTLKVRDTGRR